MKFEDFSKICREKFKFHENRPRIMGTVHEYQYTFFITSCSFLLRMRNVSNKICRENQSTYFMFSNFFPKNVPIYETKWKKYCRAQTGHRWYNMGHVNYMLDAQGYKHTLRICNTYCFPTATVISQMHFTVMFYVHCLSCGSHKTSLPVRLQSLAFQFHHLWSFSRSWLMWLVCWFFCVMPCA
jgi:hypothetical protein